MYRFSLLIKLTLILLVGLLLASCSGKAEIPNSAFIGTPIDPPQQMQDFTLTDQNGQPFNMAEHRGKVVLLFFGYTYCPDVCPLTLSTWKKVHESLGVDADKVSFLFITVDPERDSPEQLKKHVELFSPDFFGLTGTAEELDVVYKEYGIQWKKAETNSSGGYLVDHTGIIHLIDQQGKWRFIYLFDMPAKDITNDIKLLLQ